MLKDFGQVWSAAKKSLKLSGSKAERSRFDLKVQSADEARDKGDWASAADLYREALDMRPKAGWIHVQYGHALKESGRSEQAVEAYKKAAKLIPDDPDPLLHLGYLLKDMDNPQDAHDALSRRQQLMHDDAVAQEIKKLEVHHRTAGKSRPANVDYEWSVVAGEFDATYYLGGFTSGSAPENPILHFVTEGWRQGRDPNDWFSTEFYLRSNPDIASAGVNPFVHYLNEGRREGRLPSRSYSAKMHAHLPHRSAHEEHAFFAAPGPMAETFNPGIAATRSRKAKVLAYYLPQFHAIPENDAWWGKGFTEWRNVVRGLPRFRGHYQPRIPSDLGFYDLTDEKTLREQAKLAAAAGLHGFCFYYYSFNGQRLLSAPTEKLLATPDIDFPFCLMWANENWTKTWDGLDRHVLMSQDYRPEDEDTLIDDLARHFADSRYIRIDGRPLFFIYRPGIIPEARETIERWRAAFETRHDMKPLFYMAQGFGDTDPTVFGLDGAIEFPPHKLAANLPASNGQLEMLDTDFTGHVVSYDDVVARSLDEPRPDFPLIKTATPSWDNEARRPGRGMLLHGSTPEKFEDWVRKLVREAASNPAHGEAFVAVNAWNEWAEGAYLEPDIHYGAAYLNALARAVVGAPARRPGISRPILIVGHDAYPHGAQMLVRNLGQVMSEQFGCSVSFLICGEGPLLSDYATIGDCSTLADRNTSALEIKAAALWKQGIREVIVNTTVSGWTVPIFKKMGFSVTCLIHELATLIGEYDLEKEAKAIARNADVVVFPAMEVRDSFVGVSGPIGGETIIRPQGLYRRELLDAKAPGPDFRENLGIPQDAKIVMNVGYADTRKGFDLFIRAAMSLCAARPDIYFLWVGNGTVDVRDWQMADVKAGPFGDRILLTGFVNNVNDYYTSADVLFLTSREDPFPSVILEAMAAGLPVVAFKNSGGCVSLVSQHGKIVDRNDQMAIDRAIIELVDKPNRAASRRRHDVIARDFRFDDYAHALLALTDQELRTVSVAVPSYNYARYMDDRLTSIFAQTYPVLETLVLDDVSTDGSPEAAIATAERENRAISVIVNKKNSGNVFCQWREAAKRARGEYLWIAEADDVADPAFIESLVSSMDMSGAAFGFTDSWQIGPDDEELGSSYKFYINGIAPGAFDNSFVMDGREFLARFLSIKNVVLNVSGVLWRRSAMIDAMDAIGDELFDFKVAGDWRIYAQACLSGPVVFESRALNGHRRHATSVTHALAAQRHYDEVTRMQDFAATQIDLDDRLLAERQRHLDEVKAHLGMDEQVSQD